MSAEADRVSLPRVRAAIDALIWRVCEAMARCGYDDTARFAVRLGMEEAISNAFVHGHRALPLDTPVCVTWRVEPGQVEIVVEDCGPGFDPAVVPDPTLDENLEMPCGRGLVLMRAYMTTVEYNSQGNRVRMVYRRLPSPPAGT